MKIKKILLFMILFMIGLVCVNDKFVLGEENPSSGGVSLSPVYMDLGSITKTKSFTVSIMNEGKAVRLKAKIDNAGSAKITVSPDTLTLSQNERKDVTITLHNDASMKNGVYDLSIAFIKKSEGKQSIIAFGTNSLRLVFRKEGLVLATCNIKDIAPIQVVPFYSILCNFYNKSKIVNVSIDIHNKATGELIWKQSDTIKMKSYPVNGFYGKVDTPISQTPWEAGDYIYSLVVKKKDKIILKYQKEFNIGEMKGKLESVATKDVHKGELADFKAVIKNIGTQKLPVSVQISVKDKKNNTIYRNAKSDTLLYDESNNVNFKWPTKYTKIGRYSIDYTVNMGNQKETGTLYYKVNMPCYIWWIMICCIILLIIILFVFLIIKKNIKIPDHQK